jgi:Kef-type K+ transport system membrane component KefB
VLLASSASGAIDPVAPVLLWLAVILVAAKVGGEIATRLKQPAVLGELCAGVLLGNLDAAGIRGLAVMRDDPSLDLLARFGVVLLLFGVGLESTVREMLRVGLASFSVAVLGVVAPFALGWGVGAWLLPGAGPYVHAFLGATLSATSVGITARVLDDLGRSRTDEARIILGAAVIDDVLGLLILAVVSGAVAAADGGGGVSYRALGITVLKAAAFLVGALVLGVRLSPAVFAVASRFRARGVLLALGLALCFVLSWLSAALGLAPIVGAFAAGLVLEDAHYRAFVDRGEHGLDELVKPISSFLVPVFFVLMGMRTDVRAFAQPGVAVLALALTAAAAAGKLASALGVWRRGVDRLAVAVGMIPRGEVGLIFASIGASLTIGGHAVIDRGLFSAIVVMVMATTLMTPPALKWAMGRKR